MTTASLDTYYKTLDKMAKKRKTVYLQIESSVMGLTIREAMSRLGWPYNTTSARFTELANLGFIKPYRDQAGDCTRDGMTVWITAPSEQIEALAAARTAARPVPGKFVQAREDFDHSGVVVVTVQVNATAWANRKSKKLVVKIP